MYSAYANPSFEERESMAGSLSEATQNDWCQEGSRLLPQYTLDDSLTVFLSMVRRLRIFYSLLNYDCDDSCIWYLY